MINLAGALRRLARGRDSLPPFLDDPSDEVLSVGRDLYENPQTVRLPDGRQLSYGEVGDSDGDPVVAFHGVPSGRLGAAALAATAHDQGVRLLAPERPGVGGSDPDPDRTLTDWPADVTALLDALDVDAAPVFGISGGGPYALACGAVAPDRFPRIAVCCGVGPMAAIRRRDRLLFQAARYTPRVVGTFLRLEELSGRYAPERTLVRRAATSAPRDHDIWHGEVGQLLVASVSAAFQHHGADAFVRDIQLYASDWEFDLEAIDVPVGLWYGRADQIIPLAMGQYLFEAIPSAEAHFYPDLGHVSTIVENEATIVNWLQQ